MKIKISDLQRVYYMHPSSAFRFLVVLSVRTWAHGLWVIPSSSRAPLPSLRCVTLGVFLHLCLLLVTVGTDLYLTAGIELGNA